MDIYVFASKKTALKGLAFGVVFTAALRLTVRDDNFFL